MVIKKKSHKFLCFKMLVFKKDLFIYFWLCCLFFFFFCCGVQASHCSGFSCCRAWVLDAQASVVVVHRLSSILLQALKHCLSSYGAQA